MLVSPHHTQVRTLPAYSYHTTPSPDSLPYFLLLSKVSINPPISKPIKMLGHTSHKSHYLSPQWSINKCGEPFPSSKQTGPPPQPHTDPVKVYANLFMR